MYIYAFHFKDTSPITNGMAVVIIDGLQCEVTYITAEGTLNGALVGPRSSHRNISAGPCPLSTSSTVSPNTSKNSKCVVLHIILCICYNWTYVHTCITVLSQLCTYDAFCTLRAFTYIHIYRRFQFL